jgi:hypothetical protein
VREEAAAAAAEEGEEALALGMMTMTSGDQPRKLLQQVSQVCSKLGNTLGH